MRALRIACVRAPDFGLTWWLARHPEYAAQPVVEAVGRQSSALVVAVNAAAREHAVQPGLTVSQAKARAPALHVQMRDEQSEQENARHIVTRLQTITPAVEEETPGLWYLESLGQGRLYGNERNFIRRIFHLLQPCAVPVCIGLGGHRAVARVAAMVSALGSFTIVPEGSERKFLSALPSHHLAATALQPYLRALGLDTISQVAALPASQWTARFGAAGEAVQKVARGQEGVPFSPQALPEVLSNSAAFEFPLFCRLTLVHQAEELLAPLLTLLRSRQQAARSVRINLDLEDGTSSGFDLTLSRSTCVASLFARQWAHQLTMQSPRAGVRGIFLRVVEMETALVEQASWSAPRPSSQAVPSEQKPGRKENIKIPEVHSSTLPETAVQWHTADHKTLRASKLPLAEPDVDIHALSSVAGLRLFSPPRRVRAVWSNGAMTTLDSSEFSEHVRLCEGPWVVSGGWWSQPFHRLYYEVETDKSRYLVFYDREGGHWHLQGVFD